MGSAAHVRQAQVEASVDLVPSQGVTAHAQLAESYNPKLWIDPVMKEAAYPSV